MNLTTSKTVLGGLLAGVALSSPLRAADATDPLPTFDPTHTHMRQLVQNALLYLDPKWELTDPASGYPLEGWNDDPATGLHLRGFTQLTSIGKWLEILGHLAARHVTTPVMSAEEALKRLDHLTENLVLDQMDPRVSDRGLLCNFLGFEPTRRIPPLASEAHKVDFIQTLGEDDGKEIWRALTKAGWIAPFKGDEKAEIRRYAGVGLSGFVGPLEKYNIPTYRLPIMSLMELRTVTIIYGDNANLTASVGKTIGTLLDPVIAADPVASRVRERLEVFLENQHEGYHNLYNPARGLFYFGWNATRKHWIGWADGEGRFNPAHADYLVNEFRGPTEFVAVRFGLPVAPLRNMGLQFRFAPALSGDDVYTAAGWDGSAFQLFGLSLSMNEPAYPGWRDTLQNAVRINLDFARRNQLPGFLSEAYSGNGIEYTGRMGVPDIAVTQDPRITTSASLYTLGVAYALLPADMESFVRDHWTDISTLFTPHGPWEGIETRLQAPIKCQTAAHTLSLVLGALNKGSESMMRYLARKGLTERVGMVRPAAPPHDFFAPAMKPSIWSPEGSSIGNRSLKPGLGIMGGKIRTAAITWDFPSSDLSLANGTLVLRYINRGQELRGVIQLESPTAANPPSHPVIHLRLHRTPAGDKEVRIPMPATPALHGLNKFTLLFESTAPRRMDVDFPCLEFLPGSP